MALARPVISSIVGGMKEVINDESIGVLINPHSTEAISTAIVELFKDPKRCDSLGRNSEKRIHELFDVMVIDEMFEGIYRKMENS